MPLLPHALVTDALLPFLDLRTKLTQLSRLCRSIPAATATSFRHGHVVLNFTAAQRCNARWSSAVLPLLSEAHSL